MQLQIIHFELLTAVMILLFISFNLAKLKAELGRTLVGTTTRHEGQNQAALNPVFVGDTFAQLFLHLFAITGGGELNMLGLEIIKRK